MMTRSLSTSLPAVLGFLAAVASPVTGASFEIEDDQSAGQERGGLIRRGATKSPAKIWPSATIPYILTGLPDWASERIRVGMRDWEQSTCVRFVPKDGSHKNWARITKKDSGCWTENWPGSTNGEVIVNFDMPNAWQKFYTMGTAKGCGGYGIPVRQVGNLIGLIPEHRRSDREQFVHVIVHNVQKARRPSMVPYNNTDNTEPYDYNSVMHGDKHLFARLWGRLTTIESRAKDKHIGPSSKPTESDLNAVNRAYACPEPETRRTPTCVKSSVPANTGKRTDHCSAATTRSPSLSPATLTQQRTDGSSYKFIVDTCTVSWMRTHGYDTLGVVQICEGTTFGPNPTTEVHTKLGDGPGGVDHPIIVDHVPLCWDDNNQQWAPWVVGYEIRLCKGQRHCDMRCKGSEDGRAVCPAYDKHGLVSFTVDVNDTKLWICHSL